MQSQSLRSALKQIPPCLRPLLRACHMAKSRGRPPKPHPLSTAHSESPHRTGARLRLPVRALRSSLRSQKSKPGTKKACARLPRRGQFRSSASRSTRQVKPAEWKLTLLRRPAVLQSKRGKFQVKASREQLLHPLLPSLVRPRKFRSGRALKRAVNPRLHYLPFLRNKRPRKFRQKFRLHRVRRLRSRASGATLCASRTSVPATLHGAVAEVPEAPAPGRNAREVVRTADGPATARLPRSPNCSRKARKSWCRSRRNRWAPRARASPRTSLCPAVTSCTCPRLSTSVFRAKSPPSRNA